MAQIADSNKDELTDQCIVVELSCETMTDKETAREINVISRDVNNTASGNMAAPSATSSVNELNIQTMFLANMQQNSATMKTISDTFVTLQRQFQCSDNVSAGTSNVKRKGEDQISKEVPKRQKNVDPAKEKNTDGFDDLAECSDNESEAEKEEDDETETNMLLNELEECFGSSEKCGDEIMDKLAKVKMKVLEQNLMHQRSKMPQRSIYVPKMWKI